MKYFVYFKSLALNFLTPITSIFSFLARPLLIIALFPSMLVYSGSALADLQQTAIDECVLEHLTGSKLDSASLLITRSCEENYRKPNFLSKRRKSYNTCLLDHLKGVESEYAVEKILQICEKKHLRFGSPSR